MGRPIRQRFFDPAEGSIDIGGGSVSTLVFTDLGEGYYSANVAITLGAPQLPGGVQATVNNITLFGNGAINSYTILGGTGYVSAPTVTITGANTTPAVATSTITSGFKTIAITAFIPEADGGTSAVIGDIIKQTGSRRYRVRTAQGVGTCRLTDDTPAAGQMTIVAEDDEGNTYYVTKLTDRRATVVPFGTSGPGHQLRQSDDQTTHFYWWEHNLNRQPNDVLALSGAHLTQILWWQ